MSKFKYLTAIALSAIATSLSAPVWAARTSTIPVDRTPCEVIVADDGTRICKPPKVTQASSDCIRVTIREEGKPDRYIWVCTPPREKKTEQPKPANDKPRGGY